MNEKLKLEIDLYFSEYLNIRYKSPDKITIDDRYSFADTILKEEFENKKDDLSQTYKKVVLLNSLYSTNIYATFDVALKIQAIQDFRNRVASGELKLVEEIRKNIISGKVKDFYSFATKYCHHHNPNAYPIYDSFVEEALIQFSLEEFAEKIDRKKMKSYNYFKEKIDLLAVKWFIPKEYLYTKIDKYLWKKGKEMKK